MFVLDLGPLASFEVFTFPFGLRSSRVDWKEAQLVTIFVQSFILNLPDEEEREI